MGRKHAFATKAQLERLVSRMHKTCILYAEALEEFKKQFLIAVLRDAKWDKSKAARMLQMHRSTLDRTLRQLKIGFPSAEEAKRRPPQSATAPQRRKRPG